MDRDAASVGLGLLGGAFGFALGLLSVAAGIAFAVTGWSVFGIGSAYYAVGGLVVGVLFLIVAMLVRRKRRASA
jgi:glucose dehydrogenase